MKIINNLKLGKKLAIMLILPLISLSFVTGNQFLDSQQTVVQSDAMSALIAMAISTNKLLDDLVIERNITVKFQKARLKKYGEETEVARNATDQSIEKLKRSIININVSATTEAFQQQLSQSQTLLADLSMKRAAINAKKLRRNKAAVYYKQLDSSLLDVIGLLPAMSPSKEAAIISAAYANFLHIKSLAIIERNVLANVFKNDQFVGSNFADFNNSVNGQKVYESVYLSLATKKQKDFYLNTLSGDFIDTTASMRAKAFQASDYGAFGIEPEEWVLQQTGKINLLNQVANKLTESLIQKAFEMGEKANSILIQAAFIALFSIIFTLVLGYIIQKGIRGSVNIALKAVQKISQGDLSGKIYINTKDELGEMLHSLKEMQSDLKHRIESEAVISRANSRIKQALDNVSANVMLADQENNIIYINDSALEMFSIAQSDFQKDLPAFVVADLIGSNMDQFHKDPSYQQNMIENLESTHNSSFVIGGRSMNFIANPVKSDEGERIGTVVEWADRTQEVNVEKEIEQIVASAKVGNLDHRISTEGKQGFLLNLSEGINGMVAEISQTIEQVITTMSALSKGDLTVNIQGDYQGSFAEVSEHVNQTITQFANIIGEIRYSTNNLARASQEISSGNTNLSDRTEQQASALEDTAASTEELTSIVRQNSENAQQANALALSASSIANKGGGVVEEAINAMSDINQSSNQIAEIIGVIDEIAFQTNLLALNASVEAARAGEQGRGFAVVATEVRNLAQRSATAAKEIKDLIQDSVKKIDKGSQLVNESGQTLAEIVQGINKVGDIVGEIAAAGEEQSQGIQQVNNAVTSMDEITQQNAALAEQTSAASVTLTQGANEMLHKMTYFKLQEGEQEVTPSIPKDQKVEPIKLDEVAVESVVKDHTHTTLKEAAALSNDNSDEWEEF